MLYVRQLMEMFNITQAEAFTVFEHMAIDFSESTKAEFIREAKAAYKEVLSGRD